MKVLVGGINNGVYIDVTYSEKAAHITNNSALRSALNQFGALAVADAVKIMYQRIYYRDLNITRGSMAIEIIGHVVPGDVSEIIMNSSLVPQYIKDQAANIVKRASIIDSGESSVDSNRQFWDTLDSIRSVLTAILSIF